MKSILSSIKKEYVVSCHDVSEGGIGVCLSEMAIGGDIGAILDISAINKRLRTDFKLFSESNTRWILEIKRKCKKDFEKTMEKQNTPFIKIGITNGKKLIIKDENKNVVNLDISNLRNLWKNAIWDIMG